MVLDEPEVVAAATRTQRAVVALFVRLSRTVRAPLGAVRFAGVRQPAPAEPLALPVPLAEPVATDIMAHEGASVAFSTVAEELAPVVPVELPPVELVWANAGDAMATASTSTRNIRRSMRPARHSAGFRTSDTTTGFDIFLRR